VDFDADCVRIVNEGLGYVRNEFDCGHG
jgi:hypothetical protein